jgi:hypothetical protein
MGLASGPAAPPGAVRHFALQPMSKHHHILQATDEFSLFRNSA